MRDSVDALRERFGGRWDGSDREIHGLLVRRNSSLKIELLRASDWCCSVFVDGTCVTSASHGDPLAAVEAALDALDR